MSCTAPRAPASRALHAIVSSSPSNNVSALPVSAIGGVSTRPRIAPGSSAIRSGSARAKSSGRPSAMPRIRATAVTSSSACANGVGRKIIAPQPPAP